MAGVPQSDARESVALGVLFALRHGAVPLRTGRFWLHALRAATGTGAGASCSTTSCSRP